MLLTIWGGCVPASTEEDPVDSAGSEVLESTAETGVSDTPVVCPRDGTPPCGIEACWDACSPTCCTDGLGSDAPGHEKAFCLAQWHGVYGLGTCSAFPQGEHQWRVDSVVSILEEECGQSTDFEGVSATVRLDDPEFVQFSTFTAQGWYPCL